MHSTAVQSVETLLAQARTQIAKYLPRHLDVDRMIYVALETVRADSFLRQCEPSSIVQAVLEPSQLGLRLGNKLGHAYLAPRREKKSSRRRPMLRDVPEDWPLWATEDLRPNVGRDWDGRNTRPTAEGGLRNSVGVESACDEYDKAVSQISGPQLGHICVGMRGKTGHQQPAKGLWNQHRVQLLHTWQS